MKKFQIFVYLSCFFLVCILLFAIFAPYFTLSPYKMTIADRLHAPSMKYLFGTDHYGRDLFSRTIYAARVSLLIGAMVALLTVIFGLIVGIICGFYNKVDKVLMRVVDGVMAFPPLLLALALVAAVGGNIMNIIVSLTIAYWPIMTRIVRSSVLQVKEMDYIESARALGVSQLGMMIEDILPNILSPVIVQGSFIFAKAILLESSLSFLGVGIDPPTPTWGNILGDSRIYLTLAPWYSIFPGLAIFLTVLSLNVVGDALRDTLDPHRIWRNKRTGILTKVKELIFNHRSFAG